MKPLTLVGIAPKGKDVPVTLLPGIGHIPLTLEPAAVEAAISAVRSMNEPRR